MKKLKSLNEINYSENGLILSKITKNPKLIVSDGFFLYKSSNVVLDNKLHLMYKKLLDRMKLLKIDLLVELDEKSKELHILNWNSVYTDNITTYNLLLNLITHFPELSLKKILRFGPTVQIENINKILKTNDINVVEYFVKVPNEKNKTYRYSI